MASTVYETEISVTTTVGLPDFSAKKRELSHVGQMLIGL